MILIAFILVGLLLWWFGRLASLERRLRGLLLGAFVLRSAFALFLYAASHWRWPILPSLQTAPGFWAFGLDSMTYDYYGDKMVQAWAQGVELPNSGLGIDYFIVVALAYTWFGSHPLNGILLNCWFGSITALLAYLLAERLFSSKRVALTSALLVAFWPSSFVWSAQLLKDSLCWLLVFSALLLIVSVMAEARERGQPVTARRLARWIMLGAVVMLMTRLRFYLGVSLSVAVLGICLPAACHAWLQRNIRGMRSYLGVSMFVVTAMLFARTVDSFALVSPRHPELGHVRLAQRYWRGGNPEAAAAEYLRALALNKRCKEAYLGFATMMARLDQFPQALTAYQGYLAQDEDAGRRALITRITDDIRLRMGTTSSPTQPVEPATSLAGEPGFASAQAAAPAPAQPLPPAPTQPVEPAPSLAGEPGPASVQAAAPAPAQPLTSLAAEPAEAGEPVPAPPVVAVEPLLSLASAQAAAPPPAPMARDELLVLVGQAFEGSSASLGDKTAQTSAVPRPGDAFAQLTYSVAQMDDQVRVSAQQMTPESLEMFRKGFVSAGGYSLMDAWSQISSPTKLIRYLPRALAIGFLAPFPWQWFDVKGSTGIMRALAGIEVMLVYWLLPAILLGSATVLRQRRLDGLLLLAFVMCLAVPMSLVVANLGTLFRLRLQFLLPLLLLGAAGNPGRTYRGAIQWIVGKLGRRFQPRSGAMSRGGVPAGEGLLTISERGS